MELTTDMLNRASPLGAPTIGPAAFDDSPQEESFGDVLRVPGADAHGQPIRPPLDCWSDASQAKPAAADSSSAEGESNGTTETSIAEGATGEDAVIADESDEPGDDRRLDVGGQANAVIAPQTVLCDLPPPQVEQDVDPAQAIDPIEKPAAAAETAILDGAANRIALAVQPQGRSVDADAEPAGEIVVPQKRYSDETAAAAAIPIPGAPAEPRGQRIRAVIAGDSRIDAFPVAVAAIDSTTAESARIATADTTGAATTLTESASGSGQILPYASPQTMTATRLVPELLSGVPGRPTRESELPPVDAARLLHRVARAFAAARSGDGEISLRLSPPELGALRLEVKVHEGAIVAHIHTETATARTTLLDNLPTLRERLAEQGIRIERFDVDLMQHQGGGTSDRPANREPQPPTPAQVQPRERRLPQVAEGVIARTVLAADFDQRRLNVIV